MQRWLFVALLTSLCAGCSSVPEPLRADTVSPGIYYEVVRVEGPFAVTGAWEEQRDKEQPAVTHDVRATVWEVQMRLRGWGRALPWGWFWPASACQYVTTWDIHSSADEHSRGMTATHTWEPVTGALTSPEIVHRRLIWGPDDSDAIPGRRSGLEEMREILLGQTREPHPASD